MKYFLLKDAIVKDKTSLRARKEDRGENRGSSTGGPLQEPELGDLDPSICSMGAMDKVAREDMGAWCEQNLQEPFRKEGGDVKLWSQTLAPGTSSWENKFSRDLGVGGSLGAVLFCIVHFVSMIIISSTSEHHA